MPRNSAGWLVRGTGINLNILKTPAASAPMYRQSGMPVPYIYVRVHYRLGLRKVQQYSQQYVMPVRYDTHWYQVVQKEKYEN